MRQPGMGCGERIVKKGSVVVNLCWLCQPVKYQKSQLISSSFSVHVRERERYESRARKKQASNSRV